MVKMGKLLKTIRSRPRNYAQLDKATCFPHQSRTSSSVDADSIRALAKEAEQDKKLALAVLYYEKIIELWGGTLELWLSIAKLQRDMGRYGASRKSLDKALRMEPGNPQIHFEWGELEFCQRHYAQALENYDNALLLDPAWSLAAARRADVRAQVNFEEQRQFEDERERVAQAAQYDALDRLDVDQRIDPALFHPIRYDLTQNHQPEFVRTFSGIYQRTRWGAGHAVRGIESLRGYILSIVPYDFIEIYIDGQLAHKGPLTVGPVQNEQSDVRLRKYAYNVWIDFSKFSFGWHKVHYRAIGAVNSVKVEVNWHVDDIIVDAPIHDEFFQEATARVPLRAPDSSHSLTEWVRSLPTVVYEATPNSYPGPIRNVAILRLDGLGDVAVSVPFFLHLRKLLPSARLVILASADNADGCRALEIFDEVIEIDFPESPYEQGRFLTEKQQVDLMEQLAAYKFDLAITGMVSDGPRQLSVATGAPVTIGFGGDDLKSLHVYYDTRDSISGANVLNYAARYGLLAKALEVWLDSGARIQRRDDLNRDTLESYGIGLDDDFVVIHTGSRIKATEWPGYAELTNRIVTHLGLKVVYIANDKSQRSFLSQEALSDGRIVFLEGLMPFDHFDTLLSYCSSFVGNDSGPGHLATLRGAKAVRIISARLGGSEWKSEMAGVCLFRRVPCAGCGSIPISKQEECTYDIACVKDIAVEEVLNQVARLTSRSNDGPETPPLSSTTIIASGNAV